MKRILVAGELNADLVMSGLPSLPILGRELTGDGFAMVMGSSSAITAARLAALGRDNPDYGVDFIGCVGDDSMGRFVIEQLSGFGVNTDAVQTVDTPTGVTISLTYADDRAMLTYPGAMNVFDGSAITREMLSHYTHFHIGSFFLQISLQPHIPRLFEMAHELGLTTSLDPGWDPYERWMKNPNLKPALAQTDDFLPNEVETAALAVSSAALQAFVGDTLIVKLGRDGADAYTRDEAFHAPTLAVTPVDTTGAGDALNAGYIYARRILGWPLARALRFGTTCGAQAVTQIGGATNAPTAAMIEKMLE